MKIDVADYIELADGGAVVVMELDEEARQGLISQAIVNRLLHGLKKMPDVPPKDFRQLDIEDYISDMDSST